MSRVEMKGDNWWTGFGSETANKWEGMSHFRKAVWEHWVAGVFSIAYIFKYVYMYIYKMNIRLDLLVSKSGMVIF